MNTTSLKIQDLGLINYQETWALQKETVAAVLEGAPLTVLLCEHPLVLTLGRLAKEEYILVDENELQKRKADVVKIDRGGEVTLHAPGQLVIYPIVDLNQYGRDLKAYLENLEHVIIDLLADFGILATSIEGRRGVWVKERKIASIGIGVRKWVSFHGLAINVNTDLREFQMIKPCGLDVHMTSIQEILGYPVDLKEVKNKFIQHFEKIFL